MDYNLPDRYSVRQLIHCYHHFRHNPDDRWTSMSNKWMGYYEPASSWYAWFMRCLDEKITSKMIPCGKGNRAARRQRMSIRHQCPIYNDNISVLPSTLNCLSCELRNR